MKVAFTTGPNLMLWAPGSLDRLEQSEETKEFEYQQGRLKSARAWVGEQTIVTKSEARFVSHYKVWMHADVPVGFAGAEVEDTILHRDGRVIRQKHSYAIQDAGDGAKSELPDNN